MGDSSLPTTPTKKSRRSNSFHTTRSNASREQIFPFSMASLSNVRDNTIGESSRMGAEKVLSSPTPRTRWPAHQLPVEIFDEIISYLPRSTVKNMRMVNKEFEKKVSSTFFQVVVVPFRPEIYGIAPDPPLGGSRPGREDEMPQGAIMLQDKGMRVFHGFGGHIKKFAMSFEFEEEKLARPPTKDDQQAITSFWGIYPWPYTTYNRYAHLEGLEQTADETKTMASALRHITSAYELGLSIDGGLGFLSGPDINARVLERGHKPSVFGRAKYVPEPSSLQAQPRFTLPRHIALSANEQRYQECERMCLAAGYRGEELDFAVESILRNDHVCTEGANKGTGATASAASVLGPDPSMPVGQLHASLATVDAIYGEADEGVHVEGSPTGRRVHGNNRVKQVSILDATMLNPRELTVAQREMLLEIEWAQRAFMQSYTIAIIDNAKGFHNIQTLTVARLPFRHLHMLRREDFWDALPSLSKLSLAIIPDWRDLTKEPTGWVQDVKLTPSAAVSGVHQLFFEQIAGRENITTIHFEWLCGGEYSPGVYSRNQNVLPAPIVSTASNMINRTQLFPVLELPHVKHFSLKNCWSAPHILKRFLAGLRRDGVESITFDSVSLTASLPEGIQPGPQTMVQVNPQHAFGPQLANWAALQQQPPQPVAGNEPPHIVNPGQAVFWPANPALVNNMLAQHPNLTPQQLAAAMLPPAMNAFVGAAANNPFQGLPPAALPIQQLQQNMPAVAPLNPVVAAPTIATNTANGAPDWLQPPRADSWAQIINGLTPGQTIQNMRSKRGFDEEPHPSRPKYPLRRLGFTSCGYAHLPLDFDQQEVDSTAPPGPTAQFTKRASDMAAVMMKAEDCLLARVITYMNAREANALQNVFSLTVDWLARDQERAELVLDCEADHTSFPGKGRFDGVVIAPFFS